MDYTYTGITGVIHETISELRPLTLNKNSLGIIKSGSIDREK